MKIKSKGKKLDFTATAANVVNRAIGENLFDGTPLPQESPGSESTPGRAGGLKGGKARGEKLSSEKKREIAKKAAAARWKK